MKFCYVDESGCGEEPVLVMAGMVTDATRMHVTKNDWSAILKALSRILKKPIREFHTRHFYRGHGIWHDLNGNQRARVMDIIISWLQDRHHSVAFSAIDKAKARGHDWAGKTDYLVRNREPNHWRLAALHLMLCIQKEYQRLAKTKGHTVMVFDHETREEEQLAELSMKPPAWADTYYGYDRTSKKKNKAPPLSHIIDVPYFADSKHVGMLQVADLFAYLIRHYAELGAGYTKPQYSGEASTVGRWVGQIGQFMLADSNRWPATGGCDCAKLFRDIAPEPLLRVQRDSKS